MKDYDGFLNKQAEVLNEFDDFCEQFEKRAAEHSRVNAEHASDPRRRWPAASALLNQSFDPEAIEEHYLGHVL